MFLIYPEFAFRCLGCKIAGSKQSGRYEWVENPEDPSQTAWLASPALTYWQSEFVRLRAEYDILGNPGETTGQFTLRITFAMGPHKHETY